MKYFLWNTRNQGWITHGGTTSTDHTTAKPFDKDQAMEMVRLHRAAKGPFSIIPVEVEFAAELLK